MKNSMSFTHATKLISACVFVFVLQACSSTENTILMPEKPNAIVGQNNSESVENLALQSKAPDASAEKKDNGLPQRIAVMPFNTNEDTDVEIAKMLRQSVFSHLSSTNYLFVRPQEVDQRILILEEQRQFTSEDAELLTGLLDSDAILIGEILSTDVTYVGVAAQIYYKVEMSLVNKHGQVLWSDVFSERSIEGGVSADPFSMLYNLAVTAMHLGQENLFAVADKIGRQVATTIPQPEGAFTVNNLLIENVIHDAVNTTLKYGDTVKVGVKAPANMSVTVSIESIPELFNAIESDAGTYFVDIPISSNWNGKNLLLTAYILDKTGNRARKISTVGLINIDNIAPEPVQDISLTVTENLVEIKWQHPEANLDYFVYEITNDKRTLLTQTKQNSFEVTNRAHTDFTLYSFEIVSVDGANNTSSSVFVEDAFLPSNALRQSYVQAKAKLPKIIGRDTRLTKQHSPYLVDDKVKVASDAILFIEPGVNLQFTQSGNIEVLGSLDTFGQSLIEFTALNKAMSDQTFITINSNKHVSLNGFAIRNAGIAIEVLKGKPTIENCEIMDSKYSALSIVNTANVQLNACIINGSNTSAVVVANNGRLTIRNSQLLNNFPFHIQNSSTYRVDARNNQWQPAADVMTVLGNVIY